MQRWLPPPDDYARVYQAADEPEALLVQRILQDAGIPVLVRSRQVPGYAEVIRGAIGVWGDILVPKAYENEAQRYVQEYLRALKENAGALTAGDSGLGRGALRPKVIFFDYGGTLVYGDPAEHIWLQLLEELGFPADSAAIQTAYQEANEITGQLNIYDYHGRMREFWRRYNGVIFERLGIADPRGNLEDAMHAGFQRPDWYHLYPDVRDTLATLRAKRYQLGIISNNVDEMLMRMQDLQLTHSFDTVTYSQEARADKPDPAIFRIALDRAGCAPEDAVHVGDSYEADVLGARGVGITPVLIDRDQRAPDVDCLRITDLREITHVVEAYDRAH